jgi:hypothetical protein
MTAFENQTPLSLTFCDVSKAFDRVWIRGLIYKLEKYGMRGDILELFKTYRTDTGPYLKLAVESIHNHRVCNPIQHA